MKAIHEFIIELPTVLNETFKTENGTEFYAHKKFSVDRLSNRVAKVITPPAFNHGDIKAGYEVMIEPTFMYKQIYKGIEQDYTNWVDRDKKWFRVIPSMIILYRKDKDSDWVGFGNNLLVTPIKETEPEVKSELLIIPKQKRQHKREYVTLLYPNKAVIERGANKGDEVIINPQGGVKFWIDGKEHWWIRSKDLWAIVKKNYNDVEDISLTA